MIVPPEQNDINKPRDDGEHGFIDVFCAEEILHIEQTGAEHQRQQHDAHLGDVKHLTFNGQQRRHILCERQTLVF